MSEIIKSPNQSLVPASAFHETLRQVLETPVKSKPYTARMTRETPSAFVFLLDQSGSMEDEILFAGKNMSKAEAVATIVNSLLNNLLDNCSKGNEIQDYFDLAIIGYGKTNMESAFAWEGNLAGRSFVKPSELDVHYLEKTEIEVEDDNGWGEPGITYDIIKKWINPIADGLTPMCHALNLAAEVLEKWIVEHQHRDSFPPVVVNITDGNATDAKEPQLLEAARRIKNLHTTDGHVLLLNIHLSTTGGEPVIFPAKPEHLPNAPFARLLYDMSSEMPDLFNPDIAKLTSRDSGRYYTGMAYNSDMHTLVRFLQIGTITPMKGNDNKAI